MKNKLIYFWRYWFWQIGRAFVLFYIRPKFNFKLNKESDPIPKPPFIMVSNHGTFFDPWIVGHLSRYPLSIMNNEEAFKAPPIQRWYMKQIGTFPKKKGASDYKAVKITLKKLKRGYPILIFPEGQTSWDGETQPVFPGVEKIIKLTGASLVMMNIKGNFLSKPWWSYHYRKGQVRVTCKVLTPEKVKTLSVKEILELLIRHIRNSDIKDAQNQQIAFKGENCAEGLEHFVWICRTCCAEDTLTAKGNTITCSACGSLWHIDAHCKLTPGNEQSADIGDLHDWASWHKQITKDKIAKTDETNLLTANDHVTYCVLDNNGASIDYATGSLTLSKKRLAFKSRDEQHSVVLQVKNILDYVYQRKELFECRTESETYTFRFPGHSPMKWVFYFRYLNNYEACEKRMYL